MINVFCKGSRKNDLEREILCFSDSNEKITEKDGNFMIYLNNEDMVQDIYDYLKDYEFNDNVCRVFM